MLRKILYRDIWLAAVGIVFFIVVAGGCSQNEETTTTEKPEEDAQPVSTIVSSPLDGETYFQGKEILFEAVNEDGEVVNGPVNWMSNLDGRIGHEPQFKYAQLSVGNHTITATVQDDIGSSVVDALNVAIEPFSWAAYYRKNDRLSPRISNEPLDIETVDRILKTTKNFDRKNLSGIDMIGKNFNGASFENAFMVHSNFQNRILEMQT